MEHMQPAYDESHALAVAELFDATYYLAMNHDVREQHIDPLAHFLVTGWREGRNPSRSFDVPYYQRTNPDVVAADLNPLVHFAWCGAREGRLPRRPLDTLRGELGRVRTPRVRAREWTAGADHSLPIEPASLARSLKFAVASRRGLVVSIGHDDYDRNLGGVQNVIRAERLAFEQMDLSYLNISPAAPLPMLADPITAKKFRFALRLGSERLGVANSNDLLASLLELHNNGVQLLFVIHHFMGHAPEALLDLVRVIAEPPLVWVHDYFTLCPSYNLLRNDICFCGGPPVASTACTVCLSGADRTAHARRMTTFFEAARPVVLAPSEVALGLWRHRSNLPHQEAHVQPLARLILASEPLKSARSDAARPLRIAHLGVRTLHKGWPVFEELALSFAKDPAYAFYQLGISHGAALCERIRHVDVQVSQKAPDAMVEAIAEHGIDVVINWSFWPETFCFAVHEALAGGSFVLARGDAGNVPHAIINNAPNQGYVVKDKASLFDLFESGRLNDMLRAARRRRGVLIAESGSAAWFRQTSVRFGSSPYERSSSKSCLPNTSTPVSANV